MGSKDVKDIARILVYKEEGRWIAHCLEFDLLADGENPDEAVKGLMGVIITHIEHLEETDRLDQLYHPAPQKYWKKLAKAARKGVIKLTPKSVPTRIPSLPIHEMTRLNLEYSERISV